MQNSSRRNLNRSRGYLPHFEREGAVYFVTFRLKDSLPREFVATLRKQREMIERAKQAGVTVAADHELLRELKTLLKKAERLLDGGRGACYMRDPEVARVVANALRFFDGERYRLTAWCVMPNHAHAVLSPMNGHRLDAILHSWKSYSSTEANKVIGRTGTFWQREYFDHLVRNEASLAKIVRYVSDNPRKAGLRDWPWVFPRQSRARVGLDQTGNAD